MFGLSVNAEEQFYSGLYLSGRLLVAEDSMPDYRFRETVILILEHDASGAFGVVLNRPIGEGPLGNLLTGFGKIPNQADETALTRIIEMRSGGPVEQDRAIVVHSTDYQGYGSHSSGNGIAWTLEASVLQAAALGRGPEDALVFMGYAGWGRGQLEKEIGRGDWLESDTSATVVFETPVEELYETVLNSAGLTL